MPEESRDPAALMCKRFLAMICNDALAARCTNLVVAFDGDKVFRFKLYAKYKGERGEGSKVYDHLDLVKSYLDEVGIQVIHAREYESDDILCSIANQGDMVGGTRDKDSYQYLRKGVRLFDSSFKVKVGGKMKPAPRFITHEDVPVLLKGLTAKQSLDYQTLIGDEIDGVPQLVTPARARNGIMEHGTLKAWLAADKTLRRELKPKAEQLNLNRKLVRLVPDLKLKLRPIQWNKDVQSLPNGYANFKTFCNPRSKGLF
jgi:5'-3' exonuclease